MIIQITTCMCNHKLIYLVENSLKIFCGQNLVRLLSGMKTIPKHIIMSIRTYVSSEIVTQHSNFNQSGSTTPSINHLKPCHIYHDKHTVLLFWGIKQRGLRIKILIVIYIRQDQQEKKREKCFTILLRIQNDIKKRTIYIDVN